MLPSESTQNERELILRKPRFSFSSAANRLTIGYRYQKMFSTTDDINSSVNMFFVSLESSLGDGFYFFSPDPSIGSRSALHVEALTVSYVS